jgi:hypothetical protein
MSVETPRPTLEKHAGLRAKLEKLARFGILASALTGILPAELRAQESGPPPTTVAERMEKLELAKVRADILLAVGPEQLDAVEHPPVRRNERPVGEPVPVRGFEDKAVTARAVTAVIANLPPSFRRRIAEVRYEARTIPLSATYGLSSDATEVAHADRRTGEILFSAGADGFGPILISDVLEHETCHVADPSWDTDLSESERIRFYSRMLGRLNAPDRYRSSYVEGIRNPDPRMQMRLKVNEYWAEVCGAYLRDAVLLPAADRDMVQAYVSRVDPSRTPEANAESAHAMNMKIYGLSMKTER